MQHFCFIKFTFYVFILISSQKDWLDSATIHCKEPIQKIRNKYSQKRNCAASVPIPHSRVCERFIYIPTPTIDLPILLQEICGPMLGIYKSLTDTWMWKMVLGLRNSHKRNTLMGFSLQCINKYSEQVKSNPTLFYKTILPGPDLKHSTLS
jgi:hypothetical protein